MFTIKRSPNFNPFGYRIGQGFNPGGVELGKLPSNPDSMVFWRAVKPTKLPARNPAVVLQRAYPKTIELAFVTALIAVNLIVQLSRDFGVTGLEIEPAVISIEVADIPATRQFCYPPPPPKPTVPVPTGSETIPEDLTIVSTEVDLTELPPPPAPTFGDDSVIFIAYDTPPSPVGGLAALYNFLEYPQLARRAKIEATVVARALINTKGKVEDVQILKGSGNELGFEEAVISAIHKLQWLPARQRDRAVKVWVTVPVQFSLNSDVGTSRSKNSAGRSLAGTS